ncbi:hypothetical protein [Comamonas terrigena]|uniref:hypothetical protein n=1 Tax=Comamonas terrigena TaxID=32013 RepID=UPI002897278E|nr:hypothetical protein [Comamonas terrigena]
MINSNNQLLSTGKNNLPIIKNWRNKNNGDSWSATQEYPLYTDAGLHSEQVNDSWPYAFLNALAVDAAPGKIQAGLIFRCAIHGDPFNSVNLQGTEESAYHGGLLYDEASALSSLILGIRVRAGECTRIFGSYVQDPFGRPRATSSSPPTLSRRNRNLIAPSLFKMDSLLSDLSMLDLLLDLNALQSVSLLRAARLYQDSLWIIESEPELAWLMLVSALEVAALSWDQKEQDPVDVLKSAKFDFYQLLKAKGDDIVNLVAQEISSNFRVTSKFVNFCLHFLPNAPETRPQLMHQIDWTRKNWKNILNKVYSYRSRALHGGHPFPRPMCEPPDIYVIGKNLAPCEKGTASISIRTHGSSWNASDLPVSLNTFVQLTRDILLSWWRHIADENSKRNAL